MSTAFDALYFYIEDHLPPEFLKRPILTGTTIESYLRLYLHQAPWYHDNIRLNFVVPHRMVAAHPCLVNLLALLTSCMLVLNHPVDVITVG